MKVIDIQHASGRYPVYVAPGLIDMHSVWTRHLSGRVLIVTDDTVGGLYLDRLLGACEAVCPTAVLRLPPGEEAKTAANWLKIIDALIAHKAQRDATIIALGGGVIGDLAGFAAASYMRGIQVIQFPTTLLAQVDASVGGKTGFNHAAGKNLIGAFHQPAAVVADLDTLSTLDERDYLAGMAEVVKYGAIGDPGLFGWMEVEAEALKCRLPEALLEAVSRSVRNKAEVVRADERESGQRALLNFGHTFGHALETATAYARYRHGEAVAIGMVLATRLSELIGLTEPGPARRLLKLLERLGLPTELPKEIDRDRLVDLMRLDKKNRADQLRLILLESIGKACIRACAADDVREVLHS